MNTCIITASHLRPRVFKLFCLSMNRLRKDSGLDIHVICSGDKDQAKIAEKFNIEFIPMPNKPVSRKFQKSLTRASNHSPDSVIILGSDDIISTQTAINLHGAVCDDETTLSGLSLMYFYSALPGSAGRLLSYQGGILFGAGKILHKSLLDKLDWVLWEKDANYGLDGMAHKRIKAVGCVETVSDGILVDVKTRMNMNKFSLWDKKLESVDAEIFHNILSEEEKQQLKVIIKNEII